MVCEDVLCGDCSGEQGVEKEQVIGRERGGDHRDSGMGGEVDQESKQRFGDTSHQNGSTPGGSNLKRGAINNSLLDLVTDSGSVLELEAR